MVRLPRALGWGYLCKGTLLALFVALSVNVTVTPPKAMAGGAIMVGFTIVTGGKDRVSGKTYQPMQKGEWTILNRIAQATINPSLTPDDISNDVRRIAPQASVIRVYPGDHVGFTGIILNVDPFPIPGGAVLTIHQKGLNDSLHPLNLIEYAGRNIVASRSVFTMGTGVPVTPGWSNYIMRPPGVTLASSAKPGQQLCQFVSTLPMFYLGFVPVIPYFEWKIPDLINFNLGFSNGNLSGSASDANGNSYDVDFDPDSPIEKTVIDNDGKTQDTHSTFRVSYGRTMSCAEVAYVYDLEPSLTLDESSNTGSTINVNPAVSEGNWKVLQRDAPAATETQKTQWQISRLYVPSNKTPPSTFTQFADNKYLTGDKVCKYFKATYNYDCAMSAQSGTNILNRKDTIFSSGAIGDPLSIMKGSSFPATVAIPSGVPSGYKVCYVLSINSHRPIYPEWNAQWRNSKVVCAKPPNKKPKVQILGDDVRVGGKIVTSLTDLDKTFGSWVEYASYSSGETLGFGSASGMNVGGGVSLAAAQLTWSKLTFANSGVTHCDGSSFGCFGGTIVNSRGKLRGVFEKYVQGHHDVGTPVNLTKSDLSGGKILDYGGSSSAITIDEKIDDVSKTVIIFAPDATVKINEDITYTSNTLSSLDQIPQVVIVAKNIEINEGVKQVDAWLIADDTIDTCPLNGRTLTLNICKNHLQVNGPVATNHLLLNRTAGSDGDDPGAPAETFNNNGLAYLWAKNFFRDNATNGLVSTYQMELSPRL